MSDPQSANPEVRIGILGSGWMGSVHAECYQRIKGAKVVGVFSRNLERAEAAAKISGILNFDSGANATVMASGIMPKGFPFSIGFRVLFEKGAFELKTVFEGAGPPKNTLQFYSDDGVQTLTIEEHDPYEQELRHFVSAIRGNADPGLLYAYHANEALKLSHATLQSTKENRVIRMAV